MATYKIKTKRYIRKYTAAERLPVSAALIDAQRVVDELCKVPWEQAEATTSIITSHDESELDANVSNRDRFDAALFCADHANGAHRAYANAACYKIPFPTGTAGKKITSLKVRVTSDAYNAAGARIALVTNSTGVIPTSCAECRGEGAGGIHAAGVAPQTIQTVGGQRYGYPTIADCIFSVSPGEGEYALPEGGLTLGSYLYVFVLMENYNSVRGNWLEGSSCIVNQIEIVTDSAITGWTDGALIDLTQNQQTTLHLVNLLTGETDDTINLGGPIKSMAQIDASFGPTATEVATPLAIICGDFPEASISGVPGLVVYDYRTKSIATVTEDSTYPIPDSIRDKFRSAGVYLMASGYAGVAALFDYEPVNGLLNFTFTGNTGSWVVIARKTGDLDFTPTSRKIEKWYGQSGYSVGRFYNDRVQMNFVKSGQTSGTYTREMPNILGRSGSITYISGSVSGKGYCLVSGNNTIGGNSDPVKQITCDGRILPYWLNLKPDTFDNFKVREVMFDASTNANVRSAIGGGTGGAPIPDLRNFYPPVTSDPGKWPIELDVDIEKRAVETLGWFMPWRISGLVGYGLLLTGSFSRLGDIEANGAAFVYPVANDGAESTAFQMVVIPLDIGRVRNACIFNGTEGIPLHTNPKGGTDPIRLAHLLVEYS